MSTIAQSSVDRSATERVQRWGPALVVLAIAIVTWQWLLPLLGVERFLLPPLSDVLQALWD